MCVSQVESSTTVGTAAATPAVLLNDVTVMAHKRLILDHVSLRIPAGAIVGIVGPNGAGKTTMLRLLAGLIERFTGAVQMLGYALPRHSAQVRSSIGIIPERDGLYDDMRVIDVIDHWARLYYPTDQRRRQDRIRTVLEHMDLLDRRNDRCGTLSLGLRKRVAIARATLIDPPLLLLDEVTNGLDILSRNSFYSWLAQYYAQEPRRTIIMATHNTAEAARLCSDFVVLCAGRTLFCGSRAELVHDGAGVEAVEAAFLKLLQHEEPIRKILPG